MFNNPLHINIDEHRLTYYRFGEGEPVVMIHGITTYSFIWENMIPIMADKHTLFVIDLPGCGDSTKSVDISYSIGSMAGYMLDFIDQMQLQRVHLLCHDVGGGIGQIMAVKQPQRFKSLTLINSVGYNYWPVQPIVTMRTPFIRQLAVASLDGIAFRFLIKRGLHYKEKLTEAIWTAFRQPIQTAEGRKALLHFAHCLNSDELMEIADQLKLLPLPVLIIRGEKDVYLSKQISEELHKNISGSNYYTIPTAGHYIQIDEPRLLCEYILDFYRRSHE